MPMSITNTTGGITTANPFVGPLGPPDHVLLDVSGLTTKEVDTNGYLKPGVPLTKAGILVGASPAFVYGVTCESQKIVPVNPTDVTLAAVTVDPLIAVITGGLVNRDIIEDNLGRALTADEIAGFDRAGSKIALTTT